MESIAVLEESIGWRQEEVRPAARLGQRASLEAMISGTADPDRNRRMAAAEPTEAPVSASAAVGQQGVGPAATIKGGDGDDQILGRAGADTLAGGPGADRFVYRSLGDGGDVITDFSPDEGDVLQLSGALNGAAVRMADDGTNTTVSVRTADADAFSDLVVLENYRQPIDVWYGDHQRFGAPGEPQRWVNILGNVSRPGLALLTYSLNGEPAQNLALGPDSRRLNDAGDFNIELSYDQLDPSPTDDVVRIRAAFSDGEIFTRDVTIDYRHNPTPTANYSIDWAGVPALQDVVQVVDGLWSFDASGARPALQGYDRLLAVGDRTWDSYEVSLTITPHDLDTKDPSGRAGAIALAMLWDGHTYQPVHGPAPHAGWVPGALFAFTTADGGTVRLRASDYVGQLDVARFRLEQGCAYSIKLRNERAAGFDRTYKLKIWELGEPEPAGWLVQGTERFSELVTGSLLLNAHYVDVTFGDITVTQLSP